MNNGKSNPYQTSPSHQDQSTSPETSRIYVLQGFPPRILSMREDGADVKVLVKDCGGTPDGLVIDRARRHLYWTNMGRSYGAADGFIERIDLDGTNRKLIVPPGATFTPKQIDYDPMSERLYWSDREGMRIMSARRDGSEITVLVETGSGEADRKNGRLHCVGIALDLNTRTLYWSQKGSPNGGHGRICKAGMDIPVGALAHRRPDVKILLDNLPEPIDLLFDHETRVLFWTDRGSPPLGNTLNRARPEASGIKDRRVVMAGLREGIGVCMDGTGLRLFVTDLGGRIYAVNLDGDSKPKVIHRGMPLTGIAVARGA